MNDVGTVERAYQLARSGKFKTVSEIETALIRERYEGVREHLSGGTLRKELKALVSPPKPADQREAPSS
jgi:hypothetical protein